MPGRLALQFDRKVVSAFKSVSSAVAEVKIAIPEAKLFEATPDLVGLTDIADIVQCSRQNMRTLMLSSGAQFPAPVHEDKSSLWRLAKVLIWLKKHKHCQIEDNLIELAKTNMQFNIARNALDVESSVCQDILRYL